MLKRNLNPVFFSLVSFFLLMLGLLSFNSGMLIAADVPASGAPSSVDSAAVAVPDPAAVAPVETDDADDPDKISLDFKDADINTVLRVLSLKSHVNIVAGPEVQGTVTIRLDNVAWDKALEVVLRTYDYVYERDESIIRVTTREKMAQEPVVTQTFILNYTRAAEILASVKDMLTDRGRIKTSERTNTVIVTDIPTNLYRIHEVIKKLDQRTPQAYIDAKIIKTDVGISEKIGIQWAPSATLTGASRPTTFPFITDPEDGQEHAAPWLRSLYPRLATTNTDGTAADSAIPDRHGFLTPVNVTADATYQYGTLNFANFQATLNFLKSRTNTKIVSNPRIVVLNNQKAKVQVGTQIPLPKYERNENTGSVEITGFKYRDVGVILNVTPHINSEEEILVELAPEVSSQAATIDFTAFQVPSFNVTIAETQVLIRSGETIAIGGLMTDAVTSGESKVPYLADIPMVGKLFRNKSQDSGSGNAKVETLFFITVTMVDTEGQPMGDRLAQRRLKKVGLTAKQDKSDAETSEPSSDESNADAPKGASQESQASTENAPQAAPAAAPAA